MKKLTQQTPSLAARHQPNEADDLIANKKVIVNGEAAALGHRITASDKVVINKKTVKQIKNCNI